MALRPIRSADAPLLREIFADAIESQAPGLYTSHQIRAWTSLAWLPGVLDRLFRDGDGWISGEGAAFAMRQPQDRLALLYCRGRASRQGHGTALVKRIECDARADGLAHIHAEASLLSRPLLERCGWRFLRLETFTVAGVPFEHHRMERQLHN